MRSTRAYVPLMWLIIFTLEIMHEKKKLDQNSKTLLEYPRKSQFYHAKNYAQPFSFRGEK